MRNARNAGVPGIILYTAVAVMACAWKWFYYAPNTLKEYQKSLNESRDKKNQNHNWSHFGNKPATIEAVFTGILFGNFGMAYDLFCCLAPYAIFMFGVIPGVTYILLGEERARTALYTTLLAETLTNLHSFIIIACNHAGDDVYKFDSSVKARSDEFYLRAVIGSVNFHTGSDFGTPGQTAPDVVDFL